MLALGKIVFAQETATITIHVENIANDKGKLILGMYTQETFMKAKPEYSQKTEIKDGKTTITFEGVPPGNYAISCFQDANENERMDFQPNGMPLEDYAVSNNPMLYGPPQWSDAKLEIKKGKSEITIRF
jgi:uncharacterized protein (DUF2141 family)